MVVIRLLLTLLEIFFLLLICCQSITMEQCSEAESRILKFCKLFENLYGTLKRTPNMHLSCHLVECIRDYGPVYSFWCFSFERYNGILGSYHKNNHNIGKLSPLCIVWYYSKSKLKGELNKSKSLLRSCKTEIIIRINPGLAKLGFEQPSSMWK